MAGVEETSLCAGTSGEKQARYSRVRPRLSVKEGGALCHLKPGLALAEVVGTLAGSQVPACTMVCSRGPSLVAVEFCASCSRLDMPRMTASPWAPARGDSRG